MAKLVLLIHFASTMYLVGLCWLVQRVQYPLMAAVGEAGFAAYEAAHVSRIGPVVAPMMILELATGAWLLWTSAGDVPRGVPMAGAALLLVIWLSTFAIQVPLHSALAGGFDATSHAALVRTNWIRTIAWSARGLLVFGWLWWTLRLEHS